MQKWLLKGVEAEQMAFLQAFATDGVRPPSSRDPFPGQEWTSPGLTRVSVDRRPVMYDASNACSGSCREKENAHQMALEMGRAHLLIHG